MPFLDRGVVDAALRCPSEMKVRRGRQKYVLSQLVRRLPAAIANRGKFGVMAPMESLVKPPLASFTREVLLDNARGHGLFNRAYLETQLDRWTQPEHYHDYARAVVLLFLQIWWTQSFTGAQQA